MPELAATCDGPNGTTCTPANTGFDSCSIGTGGSMVFDTSVFLFGTSSIKIQTGSGTATEPIWSTSLGTITAGYARLYLRIGAYPTSTQRIMFGFRNSGTEGFGFDMTTSGTLVTKDASGGSWGTFLDPIPLNTWIRLEMDVPAFGTLASPVARQYLNPAATSPTQTLTGTMRNVGASANAFSFPIRNASLGPFWIDQVAVSTTAQPGPYVVAGGAPPPYMNEYQRRTKAGLLVR